MSSDCRLFCLLLLLGAFTATGTDRRHANGIYAVLHEGMSPQGFAAKNSDQFTLVYDRDYSRPDGKQPAKYITLDAAAFVPLILAGTPQLGGEYRGHPTLSVTLAPGEVKMLEAFTRAHLGGSIAILVDDEIVTMHKVRSVVEGGKVQVSRCGDDACRVLRMKLTR